MGIMPLEAEYFTVLAAKISVFLYLMFLLKACLNATIRAFNRRDLQGNLVSENTLEKKQSFPNSYRNF